VKKQLESTTDQEHRLRVEDDQNGQYQMTYNLTDKYQTALVANISVGNPAKNFTVMFDLWSSDLNLMDWNVSYAKKLCDYDCVWENRTLHRRNLYNESASSTYTAGSSYRFYGPESDDKGNFANDLVNIGGLLKYMKFGDLTTVGKGMLNNPIDGILGLSMTNSSNYIPTVLAQIVPSLAEPVVTLHVNRTYSAYTGRRNTDAEIMFGSKALPQCNQANWQTIKLMKPSRYRVSTFAPANATSISIGGNGVSGDCDNAVQAVHPLVFSDNTDKMLVSVQALKVFQKAIGAQYNNTWGAYTVECDSIPGGVTVNIALSDNNTIVMEPMDFVYKRQISRYNSICIMDIHGAYDDGDASNKALSIKLGQTWLNRHCISYHIANNTMSYTDALLNNGN